MNQKVTPAMPKAKKGDLKISLDLHAKLKAKAALSQPRKGLNELAEEHLWPVVGGHTTTPEAASKQ